MASWSRSLSEVAGTDMIVLFAIGTQEEVVPRQEEGCELQASSQKSAGSSGERFPRTSNGFAAFSAGT